MLINMKEIVEKLTISSKTISTMESCTGGYLANAITNIPGASEVFLFGAVTYSNEYKIKLGVSKETISTYSVYSEEVSKEMSKVIADYTNSNYGIGVTGKLNRADIHNQSGSDSLVFISIYDKEHDKYYNDTFTCTKEVRSENKELVLNKVIEILHNIL